MITRSKKKMLDAIQDEAIQDDAIQDEAIQDEAINYKKIVGKIPNCPRWTQFLLNFLYND